MLAVKNVEKVLSEIDETFCLQGALYENMLAQFEKDRAEAKAAKLNISASRSNAGEASAATSQCASPPQRLSLHSNKNVY